MKKFICLFFTLFLSGCVNTAYISSVTDPDYNINISDSIYIFIDDEAKIKDRQFGALLKKEMKETGFNITDDPLEASYILAFQMGQKTSTVNSAILLPQTSYTSGYVGGTYYSGTTTSTTAIPYSSDYTAKKVWLELYSIQDLKNEIQKTVWEGYIGSDINDFEKRPKKHLRLLLNVFGTNYTAHTPIN